MIAVDVRDTDLADYQRAARTMLVHPLVTATHPTPTSLALVRRFGQPLTVDLEALAGYRLEIDASCARLVRRIDRLDDTQAVRRRNGRPFDRRRYAYLALVLAGLGRAGPQAALTELADALKRRAAEIPRLEFDPDRYRQRLAFVDVVRHLLGLGALAEVEASTVDWVLDPDDGEALYDVHRDVVHLVFVPPRVVQHVDSVGALLARSTAASRDARRAATRQRLARLLLEYPGVSVDDLAEDERRYLQSQAASIGADVQRLTGGQVERRAEGIALIDATGGCSDRRFPASGTAAQVALLLADAMAREAVDATEVASVPTAAEQGATLAARLDAARPNPPAELADDPAPDDDTTSAVTAAPVLAAARSSGPLFSDGWLRRQAQALIDAHGRTFAADLRQDPDALVGAAVEILATFDLVRRVPGGVIARPMAARFRDLVVEVAPPLQPLLLDPADPAEVTP